MKMGESKVVDSWALLKPGCGMRNQPRIGSETICKKPRRGIFSQVESHASPLVRGRVRRCKAQQESSSILTGDPGLRELADIINIEWIGSSS